jgi:TonB family protein
MGDAKKYSFGKCIWAEKRLAEGLLGDRCSACQTEIIDISTLTDEAFEALYNRSDGKLCVRCTGHQFKSDTFFLRYVSYLAVGILPFTAGCSSLENNTPPSSPERIESVAEDDFIGIVLGELPELVGGLAYLYNQLQYPQDALEAGIEGRVIVQFVIDEQGHPKDISILKGLYPSCDREAVRLVEQSEFIPSKQRGKPVPIRISLPITFKLPKQ